MTELEQIAVEDEYELRLRCHRLISERDEARELVRQLLSARMYHLEREEWKRKFSWLKDG